MSEPIDDYILATRDQYTEQAIREQLKAAGHADADIADALERSRRTPSARSGGGALFAWVVILFVVGLAAVVFGALAAQAFASHFGPLVWVVGIGLYGVLGGAFIWYISRESGRSHGSGWAIGMALLAPILLGAVTFGTCLAMFNAPA